jgi:DNA-binding NarL/FixJ family response regulator
MALKSIHVLIVEDDPYARDMMAMLLARDWRTRVVGELHAKQQVQEFFSHLEHRVDVVLMDTEFPERELLPLQIAEMIDRLENSPVTVYMGTHVDAEKIAKLLPHRFGGFLLKAEVLYALATAISQAAAGKIVLSPSAAEAAAGLDLPRQAHVLAGRSLEAEFPQRMSEILRLGLLFNLSQRDIADELVLSQNWVAEAISSAYQRLGLQEILSGEVELEDYFQDKIVLERGKAILQRPARSPKGRRIRKAPWMATLAFHLLTRPVEEPSSSQPDAD